MAISTGTSYSPPGDGNSLQGMIWQRESGEVTPEPWQWDQGFAGLSLRPKPDNFTGYTLRPDSLTLWQRAKFNEHHNSAEAPNRMSRRHGICHEPVLFHLPLGH